MSSPIIIDRSILDSESNAPLYQQYAGQTNPQPAYLFLTEDGEAGLDWTGEIGNAVPLDVWHHRTLRWSVAPQLSKVGCKELLEDPKVVALLGRIHAGHSVEWDGNNMVGRLTEDASDASYNLQKYLDEKYNNDDTYHCNVWDAGEWLRGGGGWSIDEAWPPDEPLDKAVRRLEQEAQNEGVELRGDIREELINWLVETCEDDEVELTGHHLATFDTLRSR